MYIRFDYVCPDCGHEEERFVKKEDMDFQFCGSMDKMLHRPMTRLPAAPVTHFRFNDTTLKR